MQAHSQCRGRKTNNVIIITDNLSNLNMPVTAKTLGGGMIALRKKAVCFFFHTPTAAHKAFCSYSSAFTVCMHLTADEIRRIK